jgi:hypothetical protein
MVAIVPLTLLVGAKGNIDPRAAEGGVNSPARLSRRLSVGSEELLEEVPAGVEGAVGLRTILRVLVETVWGARGFNRE